jgi:UDP-2,4-diacetamido-2,4,6-trideoxy-beta-L-altropyranose hydrolase
MTLVFRTDATVAIGTGHVMRCLALAQAWQDNGGRAVFAMAENTPALRDRLLQEGCEVALLHCLAGSQDDSRQLAALAHEQNASWVVVDGYQFEAQYQRELKTVGLRVLFLDDTGHAEHYFADLVLNQNPHATESMYGRREPYTRLLLGTRYCMLRREFNPWIAWKREIPAIGRKILVTMGGSDPGNVTELVMRGIQQLNVQGLETTVVVGGSNPHWASLQRVASEFGGSLHLCTGVSDMAELMAGTDVAVSAAGTTCWEMCLLGLPALLIHVAENQRGVAQELDNRGCAIHLGNLQDVSAEIVASQLERLLNSAETRRSLSLRGQELVDGHGAARVVRTLYSSALRIRRATTADCKALWELANDPVVRASAFSPASIPWEDHVAWLESKMRTATCHILIGELEGAVAGQVRIDERPDGEGEIDVSIAREFRGKGLGSRLIDLAVRELFASTAMARIHAYILPQNAASQQAFESAEFQRAGEERIKGHRALHYLRDKEVEARSQ